MFFLKGYKNHFGLDKEKYPTKLLGQGCTTSVTWNVNEEEKHMSEYEKQVHAISQHNDAEIRKIESQGVEVLSSKVVGSRLHEVIHNPFDEGIDEG